MNQQQKNHAISRIFSILSTKAGEIEAADKTRIEAFNEAGRVTNEDVLAILSDGTWFLSPNCKLSQSCEGTSIGNLLDLTSLRAQKKVEQDKLIQPLNHRHDKHIKLTLNKNVQWNGYVHYQDSIDRIQLIQTAFNTAADAIILGSDDEALAAIQAAQDSTF